MQGLSDGRGKVPKPKKMALPHSSNTLPSPVSLSTEICFGLRLAYPDGDGSATILRSIPQRELTLRQQQPVIAGVLDQASARFHQTLLQAREPGISVLSMSSTTRCEESMASA